MYTIRIILHCIGLHVLSICVNQGYAQADPTPDVEPVSRLPARPALTDEAYAQQARDLRVAYSQPAQLWPTPTLDPGVAFVELGLVSPSPHPKENPYGKEKAELGKLLFFDPRLSGSGEMACASCHDPDLSWADGRTTSFGHGRTQLKRNAPTLLNVGHVTSLFWDGRAASLEQQATEVVMNQDEMRNSPVRVAERLGAVPAYPGLFTAAFGDATVNLERAAMAIATFQRTIASRTNKFDTFLKGKPEALSDAAVRGLHLFRTDARCINCHMGPTFSDGKFHNENLTYYGRKFEDLGRYAVTQNPADVGRFRTPTLRNIPRTGPYMHNGLFPHLEGVLRAYNAGMGTIRRKPGQEHDPLFPIKSPLLKPLGLNEHDLADLRAFLESLAETPLRVRPELPLDAPK
ncbi:MAG: cytochrome c peroxidase [Opitutaceae bacterium]